MATKEHSSQSLLKRAFQPLNSPGSMALAIVMGILVGALPKFSVLPWVVGAVAMLLPLNLVTFILTVAVCTFAAALLDPWFHQVGYFLLTEPSLQGTWRYLAQTEAFVWLQLNNTVVVGCLLVWGMAALPMYFVFKSIVSILQPGVRRMFGLPHDSASQPSALST